MPANGPFVAIAEYAAAETTRTSRRGCIIAHILGILLACLWLISAGVTIHLTMQSWTAANGLNGPFSSPNSKSVLVFAIARGLCAIVMLCGCGAGIARISSSRIIVLIGGFTFATVVLVGTLADFYAIRPDVPMSVEMCVDAADAWIYPILYCALLGQR